MNVLSARILLFPHNLKNSIASYLSSVPGNIQYKHCGEYTTGVITKWQLHFQFIRTLIKYEHNLTRTLYLISPALLSLSPPAFLDKLIFVTV